MRTSSIIQAIACFSFLFMTDSTSATSQVSERIIINGREESLDNNPLNPYLAIHPDAFPKLNTEIQIVSSSNWRGYVGTWELSNNLLYLRKVSLSNHNPREVIDYLFPNNKNVVATWYSGTLVIPRGKLVNYVHMGYGSTYKRYLLVTVKAGAVVSSKKYNAKTFTAFRNAKFEDYKKTAEYRSKFDGAKSQEPTMTDEQIEDFVYSIDSEHYLSL